MLLRCDTPRLGDFLVRKNSPGGLTACKTLPVCELLPENVRRVNFSGGGILQQYTSISF